MTSKKNAAYGAQDENQKSKKLNQLNCVVCYEDVCKPFCRFDDCPAVGFKCGVCADGLMCAKCWKKLLKPLPLNDEYEDYHFKTLECPVCRTPHEEEYEV